MADVIADDKPRGVHAQQLLAKVRDMWDEWDLRDGVKDDMLEFDAFYNGFLAPYFGCYRCDETKQALAALDMDANGVVDWNEFAVYLKWALRQYPEMKDAEELLSTAFRKGLIPAMQDEIRLNSDRPSVGLSETDIHPYLSWNNHVDYITTKASRTLNLLRRNLYNCSPEVKARAYLSIVRPLLSYASTVWDPYTKRNSDKIEKIQRHASRFVFNKYSRQQSVTALLNDLRWTELSYLRKRDRVTMMYKILNGLIAIPHQDYVKYTQPQTLAEITTL
ncbi:hypothetical protein QZH41_012261 [Actinostola sp. cb2023]|nr:hypothetical protein QZH41_012261 [Actinostola sp. cb2023]